MDAFEFVNCYEKFILEIEQVIKPELLPVLEDLKRTDAHDLLSPDAFFVSMNHARGFVWNLFILKCKQK